MNERAKIVIEVGELKNKTDKPIYAPDREMQVFAKIMKAKDLGSASIGLVIVLPGYCLADSCKVWPTYECWA